MYKSSKDLLSGNEWYCHQAFRALNQAAGMPCYVSFPVLQTVNSFVVLFPSYIFQERVCIFSSVVLFVLLCPIHYICFPFCIPYLHCVHFLLWWRILENNFYTSFMFFLWKSELFLFVACHLFNIVYLED